MTRVRLLYYLLRYFGPRWVAYRAGFLLRRRSGWLAFRERAVEAASADELQLLRRAGFFSIEAYRQHRLQHSPQFFFGTRSRQDYAQLLSRWDADGHRAVSDADEIGAGVFTYFHRSRKPTGFPPDWHTNPFTGLRAPAHLHWSRVEEGALGDVKVVWELSRFAHTFALVRAYWRTGQETYAETFWRLVEDWDTANPTCRGVNWRCSQEIGLRVMAWCFGLYGLLDAGPTDAGRVTRLARMIWASGWRIRRDMPDALSQKNNHAVSAAAGLFTIGTLFPEFPESGRWKTHARNVLERVGIELIYEDGAFAQHSLNYQRLMLHDYLWAMRLAQLAGDPFSENLRSRVRRSAELLWELQDETTGLTPQYGQFDGSLVLPLNNCDYLDFRPVTQAVGFLVDGIRWWGEGPWDEDLLWLFGPEALSSPVRSSGRSAVVAPEGGYYALRGDRTSVMTRCAVFRHRPGQADMLHADVWWRGHNVAADAGTHSYADGGSWGASLVGTLAHNTVSVDGVDQMERCGKFLWFPWIEGRVLHCRLSGREFPPYWEGEHRGYDRLGVRHRRGIVLVGPSAWLVIDHLEGKRPHTYRLHWLLDDVAHSWQQERGRMVLEYPEGSYGLEISARDGVIAWQVERAGENGHGWRSRYYLTREPAVSLSASIQTEAGTFATLLSPGMATMHWAGDTIEASGEDWQASIVVDRRPAAALVPRVTTAAPSLRPLEVR